MLIALVKIAKRIALLGLPAITAISAPMTVGATDYPSKPITLVVPYGAGAADFSARNLAAVAPQLLGQPIVVVNKAGAGGITGSVTVKNARPDGYTLLLGRIGSQAITPALQPLTPYKWSDFTILGRLDVSPYVCVVNADSTYKTLADLLGAIRANPGKLKYSTAGPATIQALGPQMLLDLAGIPGENAIGVPFKGGGEAATATLGGHVDFNCNNLSSVLGNIKAGALRALLITTEERYSALPNVPTVAELGYKKLEALSGWSALYGPPNLPSDVVARWREVLTKLAESNDWKNLTIKAGSIPAMLSQEQAIKFVELQYGIYEALGRKLNLRQE